MGGALPGQARVGLDHQRLLIPDVLRSEAGQAQERRLMAQVLQPVGEDQRWSDDRHVCPLGLLCGMARRGATFVGRPHGQWQGECRGRPTRQGTTRSGPVYAHSLRVRDPDSGETRRGRRRTITRQEPTRDGATARHILSHVPCRRASAPPVARRYGTRWRLETAVFARTPPLAGERKTLGDPKAALCAFCLALLADNAVSLIKAALRQAQGRQQVNAEVSSASLAWDIGRTSAGRMMAMPAPPGARLRALSAKEFANVLRELASAGNLSRYHKHPRGPKKKLPERTAYQNGQHVSTAKLLAQR